MQELIQYVQNHTERGACQCGKCIDAPSNPAEKQPAGHTADLCFFKVAARGSPDSAALRTLIQANKKGEFGDVDLFDGQEHGYMELGGWIGDQGTALMLMGLGSILGLWRLLTPKSVLGKLVSDDLAMQLAGQGMVHIQSSKEETRRT